MRRMPMRVPCSQRAIPNAVEEALACGSLRRGRWRVLRAGNAHVTGWRVSGSARTRFRSLRTATARGWPSREPRVATIFSLSLSTVERLRALGSRQDRA